MNMDTWLLDIMNSTHQSECWSNPSGKLDQHQDIGHDSDYKIVSGARVSWHLVPVCRGGDLAMSTVPMVYNI